MIKVFGHLAPDTDTTASAILWAWHLNNHTTNKAVPYVLGKLNKETQFVLNKWGVDEPELLTDVSSEDEVAIVDTNNPEELPPSINAAKIISIVDHHKLTGGLITNQPVEVTMRTRATTASIIYELMGKDIKELPDHVCGLMLSCLLSDTLMFRSPTTTPYDKDLAERLAARLGIDIEQYSNEMFTAKSDMSDFTDIGLVHLDSKKYEVGDKKIRVSVVETMDAASILSRQEGIVKAIHQVLEEEKDTDDVLFFVISILNENATVLTYNELTKGIVSASFNVEVNGDTEVLPGVVSRKKQIVPALKLPA